MLAVLVLVAGLLLPGVSAAGEGYDAGVEWASDHGITDPDDCNGNSDSFNDGCRAYAEGETTGSYLWSKPAPPLPAFCQAAAPFNSDDTLNRGYNPDVWFSSSCRGPCGSNWIPDPSKPGMCMQKPLPLLVTIPLGIVGYGVYAVGVGITALILLFYLYAFLAPPFLWLVRVARRLEHGKTSAPDSSV